MSDMHSLITDPSRLPGIASAIEESSRVALDLETTGLDPRSDHDKADVLVRRDHRWRPIRLPD